MQIASFESTYPVMASIRWTRQSTSRCSRRRCGSATSSSATSCTSHRGSRRRAASTSRSSRRSGRSTRAYAILAWPVAILIGHRVQRADRRLRRVARRRTAGSTALFRFGIVPLFLFSGTFFPGVAAASRVLRQLAYVTPLWHGVDLMRHLTLGTVTWGMALVARRIPRDARRRRPRARRAQLHEEARAVTTFAGTRAHLALRAQPHGLSALVVDHLQRALRAALLSRVDRLRPRPLRRRRATASRMRATSRRRCSRRRR